MKIRSILLSRCVILLKSEFFGTETCKLLIFLFCCYMPHYYTDQIIVLMCLFNHDVVIYTIYSYFNQRLRKIDFIEIFFRQQRKFKNFTYSLIFLLERKMSTEIYSDFSYLQCFHIKQKCQLKIHSTLRRTGRDENYHIFFEKNETLSAQQILKLENFTFRKVLLGTCINADRNLPINEKK